MTAPGDHNSPTTLAVCSACGRKNRVPAAAQGIPRCASCHTVLPWTVDALDDTFASIVERARLPVLVDVWAPWCGPCRQVSPALLQLATEMAGRIKLVKVNADQAPLVSRRFDVQAIPTLMVFDRGQVIARQVGAASPAVLRAWLEQALSAREEGRTA